MNPLPTNVPSSSQASPLSKLGIAARLTLLLAAAVPIAALAGLRTPTPLIATHPIPSKRPAGLSRDLVPQRLPETDFFQQAAAPFSADSTPKLRLVEVVRIGSFDDPAVGFTRIGGVDVDQTGQIYVYDWEDVRIRVYSPGGQLIRRIGRAGDGPGEFRRPPGNIVGVINPATTGVASTSLLAMDFPQSYLAFGVLGDTVWVFDRLARRISLFSREGVLLSTSPPVEPIVVPFHEPAECVRIWPAALRADGRFWGDYYWGETCATAADRRTDAVNIPYILFDASGRVVDTLGSYAVAQPRGERRPRDLPAGAPPRPPGSPLALSPALPIIGDPLTIRVTDGRFVIDRPIPTNASQGTFRVTRLGVAGNVIFSREYSFEPVPLTAATPQAPFGDEVPSTTRFQPGVRYARIARDGALWLQREYLNGDELRWLILDVRGAPLGELTTPRERFFRILWSRGDTLFVMEPDDFNVPWLVQYRVVREDGGGQ